MRVLFHQTVATDHSSRCTMRRKISKKYYKLIGPRKGSTAHASSLSSNHGSMQITAHSLSTKNDRKTRSDIDYKRIFFSDDTFSIKKFFTRSVKLTLKRPITFQQEGLQSIKSRRSITVEWLNCEGHPPAIINIPKPPKFEQPKQTSTNSPLNSQEPTCTALKIDYTFTANLSFKNLNINVSVLTLPIYFIAINTLDPLLGPSNTKRRFQHFIGTSLAGATTAHYF